MRGTGTRPLADGTQPNLGGDLLRLPLRCGIGLKASHMRQVLEERPDAGFFEVHAENFMVPGGPLHHWLDQVREHYALSLHGVALSIGADSKLDQDHLGRLAALIARYQPQSFSEHLAWSTHGGVYLSDLLPLPYNAQTLQRVCDHVDQVQARLGRRMLLENPATYVAFAASTMDESAFMRRVVERTGCGLLLDVNNVFVSCTNHGADARALLQALPLDAVGEIHLAGFARQQDAVGAPLLIDNHGAPIAPVVWDLYQFALSLIGPTATLLERDNAVPPLAVLLAEARQADRLLQDAGAARGAAVCHTPWGCRRMTATARIGAEEPCDPGSPLDNQAGFVAALLGPDQACPSDLRSWNGSDPTPRFAVHRNNIVVSLVDALAEQFPVTLELVGPEFFRAMAQVFIQQQPPRTRIVAFLGVPFPDFIATFPPAASVPYLADLARLEMGRIETCHAADAQALTGETIGRAMADPQQLVNMRMALHPSVHLLSSPFAIFSLWAAHQGAHDIGTVDPLLPEQVLLFRDGLDVHALPISAGTRSFLARLQAGDTLAQAAEAAADTAAQDDFDLAGSMALLLRHPLVCQLEPLP